MYCLVLGGSSFPIAMYLLMTALFWGSFEGGKKSRGEPTILLQNFSVLDLMSLLVPLSCLTYAGALREFLFSSRNPLDSTMLLGSRLLLLLDPLGRPISKTYCNLKKKIICFQKSAVCLPNWKGCLDSQLLCLPVEQLYIFSWYDNLINISSTLKMVYGHLSEKVW